MRHTSVSVAGWRSCSLSVVVCPCLSLPTTLIATPGMLGQELSPELVQADRKRFVLARLDAEMPREADDAVRTEPTN